MRIDTKSARLIWLGLLNSPNISTHPISPARPRVCSLRPFLWPQHPIAINMNTGYNVTEDGLLISSAKQDRNGWEEKFRTTEKGIKNPPLTGEFQNKFDKKEWEW